MRAAATDLGSQFDNFASVLFEFVHGTSALSGGGARTLPGMGVLYGAVGADPGYGRLSAGADWAGKRESGKEA
jgi:hypothetical protein